MREKLVIYGLIQAVTECKWQIFPSDLKFKVDIPESY